MATGLIETVNIDAGSGDETVVVEFDFEDERFYINKVWGFDEYGYRYLIADYNNISGWLFIEVVTALKAKREFRNSDVEQYKNED